MRRDIASPEVIDEVAGAVGGIEILQILYLVTIADSRATGRTMWSEWKETLLRQLYLRVAARLDAIGDLLAARFGQRVDRLQPCVVLDRAPDQVAAHLLRPPFAQQVDDLRL